jgi:hypothetical protein
MAWTKAKTALVGVGVLLFVGTTMVVVKLRASAANKKDPVAYKVLHERSPQNEVELPPTTKPTITARIISHR